MQISFSSSSSIQNLYTGAKGSISSKLSNKNENSDSVSISDGARNIFAKNGQFKKNGMIQSLMKQKENLLENKNKLVEKTLKDGGNLETIKDQIKELDEQMRLLDQQISQTQVDEHQKALGLDEEDKKSTQTADDETLKTKQEVQSDHLHQIVGLAGNLDQVEQLSAQKNKMQGDTRILKTEIELDEARSISNLPATNKREKLSDMNHGIAKIENQIEQVTQSMAEKFKDVINSDQNIVEEADGARSEGEGSNTDFDRILSAYSHVQKAMNERDKENQLDLIA